jgi:hypothetical protein
MADKKVGGNIEGQKGSDSETKNLPAPVEPEKLGYKVSDDEKQLLDKGGAVIPFKTTSTGLITVDNKPLALKSVDGKIEKVSPEEAEKKAETEPKPEDEPVASEGEDVKVDELKRNLRKYSMVKDPEETSKAIKSVAGALAGGLIWAMKAENQKGGDAAEGFKNKVVDGYKAIVDKIKKGKAKSNEINKMVKENALLFQQLIKSYRETKVAARKAFNDDKVFNERAAKLRPTYARNAKELNDKATKAIETAEVHSIKYVFKTLLQDSKFQKYHTTLKKIMAVSDKLKDSKKILDSYVSEIKKAGINIQAINQYLKDDDISKLAKNFGNTQPAAQPQQPQAQQPPQQKTP